MILRLIKKLYVFARSLLLVSITLFFSACAIVPESIQSENVDVVNPIMARGNIDSYKGQTVRWGGIITQVINNNDGTWIEVLAMDLSVSGKPSGDRDQNFGRFIAKTDEFLDPEVYQEGYSFTVLGLLSEAIDGKIGEYKYVFPVVTVQGSYLWPRRSYRYHSYPAIIPGYWYYGHDPYWRFGYGYYGYGVRFHHHYYPYYPVYGHLDRNMETLPDLRRSGIFNPDKERSWPRNAKEFKNLKNSRNGYLLQNGRPNIATVGHSRSNNSGSASNSSNRQSQSSSNKPSRQPVPKRSSKRSDSKRVNKIK